MMSGHEMRESGDRCLVDYLRHLAATAPGGSYVDDDHYLLFAGGHEYPGTYTNGAIRKSTDITAAELTAHADEFFGALQRQYVVWVRDHADADLEALLRRRGCWLRPPVEGNPGIAHDRPITPVEVPEGVELRVVDDDAGFQTYRRVIAHGYQLADATDDIIETVLFSLDSLRDQRSTVIVAYYHDDPAAGGMSFMSDGEAGVEWVATLPGHRGLGLGKLVFERASNAAFAAGATCVSALASAAGLPLWTSMGFEVVTTYRRYLVTSHLNQTAARSPAVPLTARGGTRVPRRSRD